MGLDIHKDLSAGNIHNPFAFYFPDEATRLAAVGLIADDIGKWAIQEDDYSIYVLLNHSPVTWWKMGEELAQDPWHQVFEETTYWLRAGMGNNWDGVKYYTNGGAMTLSCNTHSWPVGYRPSKVRVEASVASGNMTLRLFERVTGSMILEDTNYVSGTELDITFGANDLNGLHVLGTGPIEITNIEFQSPSAP